MIDEEPTDSAWHDARDRVVEDTRVALWHRIAHLHNAWSQFLWVFSSNERAAVIQDSGRRFFQLIYRALIVDLSMSMALLVGSRRSAGRDNLTMDRLADDPRLANRPDAIKEIKASAAIANAKAAPLTVYRNKMIAHADLDVALNGRDELPPMVTHDYQATLDAITATFRRYDELVGNGRADFTPPSAHDGPRKLFELLGHHDPSSD